MSVWTFRRLLKKHFPEVNKPRVKTDMCDHCVEYRKQIVPRKHAALKRIRQKLGEVCPAYWEPFRANEEYKRTLNDGDLCRTLGLFYEYIRKHEFDHQAMRHESSQPWRIRHVEGGAQMEIKLHKDIVAACNWHVLASRRELSTNNAHLENPSENEATVQTDFMGNFPVPQAHEMTSDMWH